MLSPIIVFGLLYLSAAGVSGVSLDDTIPIKAVREVLEQCKGPPAKCTCTLQDDDLAFPADSITNIMACLPYTCQCQDGKVIAVHHQRENIRKISQYAVKFMEGRDICEIEEDKIPKLMRFMMMLGAKRVIGFGANMTKTVSSICNGEEPKSCSCSKDDDISILEFPVSNPLTTVDCCPDVCTCRDGTEVEAKAQEQVYQDILKRYSTMCSGETPESCVCRTPRELEDDVEANPSENQDFCAVNEDVTGAEETIRPPFDKVKLDNCKPKQCKCSDGKNINVPTFLGIQRVWKLTKPVIEEKIRSIMTICDGEAPDTCDCKEGGLLSSEDLTSFIKRNRCNPRTCTCKNGDIKELPPRMATMKKIVDTVVANTGKKTKRMVIDKMMGYISRS